MDNAALLGKANSAVTKDILKTMYSKGCAPQLASVGQRPGDQREKARLEGITILIVLREIDKTIPIQDQIVMDGGSVRSAYTPSRALLLATSANLDGAIIDHVMSGAEQIVGLLKTRNIPYIVDAAINLRSDCTQDFEQHSSASADQSAKAIERALLGE